jgi:competence protein ComEC
LIRLRGLIVAFASGTAWLQTRAELPVLVWAGMLPLLGLLLFSFRSALDRRVVLLLSLLLATACGYFYAGWRADLRLSDALPSHWEGRSVAFTARVIGLPETTPTGLRMVLAPVAVATPGVVLPGRVQLGWFVAPGSRLPMLAGGDCIRLSARLHRPAGSLNPGGFDYTSWLLERGIRASGQVVEPPRAGVCPPSPRAWLDRLRDDLRRHLLAALGERRFAGVVVALAVGDQDAIPSPQWTLFRQTGTSHLFSVSGLHITLFSALTFLLVRRIWRLFPALCLRLPARAAGISAGLLAAAAYTALSGFGIPAQRTLLMLSSAAALTLLDRTPSATRLLAAALAAVVLYDPWAAHAPGFWLSFGAVAALVLAGSGRLHPPPLWRGWVDSQWAVTLALTPLLLGLFQEVSLVSPLANLVAIPLISLVAVPLALLAALTPMDGIAVLAHAVVAAVMAFLEVLLRLPQPVWNVAAPALPALLLALLGAAVLLLPRGLPARWLGGLLFLPMFFPVLPAPPPGAVWLTMLDVGQGESILLRTANYSLLYDTGPRFRSGEDAGARVIAPALWQQGIKRLDAMVISHDDIDHSGGAASLLASHSPAWLLTSLAGQPAAALDAEGRRIRALRPDAIRCAAGQRWNWDGVHFDVLHPPAHQYDHAGHSDNNRSCVIRVRSGRFSILLPGDIDRLGEMNLIERGVLQASDVLISPHHGSASSSTPDFLAVVQPRWVLIPVGLRNRHGHPDPGVMARYRSLPGVTLARTDRDGAVTLQLQEDAIRLQRAREVMRRYWRE